MREGELEGRGRGREGERDWRRRVSEGEERGGRIKLLSSKSQLDRKII